MRTRVLGGSRKKSGNIGDAIATSVKSATPDGVVRKGEVAKVVVVRSVGELRRANSSHIKFNENAAIMVRGDKQPRGVRILGPVVRELRDNEFNKISSLVPEIL